MKLNNLFLQNEKTGKILELVRNNRNVGLEGLNNSRLIFFIGNIFSRLNRNILLLTSDNIHIDQYYEDLIRLMPRERILVYPEIEALPHEQIIADLPETRERLEVLQALCFPRGPSRLILTTGTVLLRKIMPKKYFKNLSLSISLGEEMDLKMLVERLFLLGYKRTSMVEEAAQFSIRGGIIDFYPIVNDKPLRIEFFGDEVDSIREFDIGSQLSENNLQQIVIPPARELIILPKNIQKTLPVIREDFELAINRLHALGNEEEIEYLKEKKQKVLEQLQELDDFPGYEQFLPYFYERPDSLLDYLPANTLIVYDETERIWQRLKNLHRELVETQATLLEQGSILPSYARNFLEPEDVITNLQQFTGIYCLFELIKNPLTGNFQEISFMFREVEPFYGKLELLIERLKELLAKKYRVIITLNSTSKAKRITEFLQDNELPAIFIESEFQEEPVIVTTGSLSEGFIIEELRLALYTEREVIGKPQRKKRQLREIEEGVKLSSLNELSVGDYVVHENHGIGKYLGVKTMEIQGQHQDYLVLKYSGEDKLYVPTDQVNLVQRYIGADQTPPRLYRLGGGDWKKVKQKVQNSVKEMAIGLLDLYAERETVKGYAFSPDTVWQKEFEEVFPYEETPDQLNAIKEVKQDMESSTPMDRLLCGDVGYGKTEVAIRAAFKAAMDGKQTAVLVPTTILAQQHFNTFQDRMENYPIKIEMISRFRTPVEQRKILKRLKHGEIDIIIGTHRLLSRDITFKDLGLLVVDEEQRFGVSHKERLKDIKRNVDVLTLTATPIPRTLHMALVGVRDMSVIETPPENRYPIRTYIREFNQELVKDAIRKEIGRDGQVYFVHNRVEDIEEKVEIINKLIPDCRIAVAHGQMNEHRLESLMLRFYNHEYDVLVCTTIIETGLDLPNVNTIIVNRADRMGLAQLYQLRGRVGRSNRIAYAYLFYERDRILPDIAEKRLRAIKEFTNLGSGFKIAMRDLEIRGAGNLLGPEQHGHIASIGFSLYCKLLENAVEELKGRKDEKGIEVEIKLDIDAYLPESYISDSRQKIEIYQKIMRIRDEGVFSDIVDELVDRYGDPPQPVMNLIKIGRIKVKAGKLGIKKINKNKQSINCYFRNLNDLEGEAVFRLIEKYPHKIKVKSGQEPVISVKGFSIELLEEVLDFLRDKIENWPQDELIAP
jgi:transcription-repair coupling factor (superfamily II helicase)